jgi:predicted flavoprotein YhiN
MAGSGRARAAARPRGQGGGEDPHLRRRALQLHQPRRHAGQLLSENPHFCRSALARYTPADFIALVERHGIAWHEKHKGQLFCDRSAEDIIDMLLAECAAGGVQRRQPCAVRRCARATASSSTPTPARCARAAAGGRHRRLSIPKIGASDFGYRLARSSATASSRRAPGWCR